MLLLYIYFEVASIFLSLESRRQKILKTFFSTFHPLINIEMSAHFPWKRVARTQTRVMFHPSSLPIDWEEGCNYESLNRLTNLLHTVYTCFYAEVTKLMTEIVFETSKFIGLNMYLWEMNSHRDEWRKWSNNFEPQLLSFKKMSGIFSSYFSSCKTSKLRPFPWLWSFRSFYLKTIFLRSSITCLSSSLSFQV